MAKGRQLKRRRLVSAQLTEQDDPDLLPWVEALAIEGNLSCAVREGLRILRWLTDSNPEAERLWSRGLLAEALKTGFMTAPLVTPQRCAEPEPIRAKHEVATVPDSPQTTHFDALENNLDSLLGPP